MFQIFLQAQDMRDLLKHFLAKFLFSQRMREKVIENTSCDMGDIFVGTKLLSGCLIWLTC